MLVLRRAPIYFIGPGLPRLGARCRRSTKTKVKQPAWPAATAGGAGVKRSRKDARQFQDGEFSGSKGKPQPVAAGRAGWTAVGRTLRGVPVAARHERQLHRNPSLVSASARKRHLRNPPMLAA